MGKILIDPTLDELLDDLIESVRERIQSTVVNDRELIRLAFDMIKAERNTLRAALEVALHSNDVPAAIRQRLQAILDMIQVSQPQVCK